MDAFVACYNKIDSFDEQRASFGTWLYVIVNNRIKNFYRDRKEYEDIDENVNICKREYFEEDVVKAQYLSELRRELAEALQSLGEVQRKVIIYKYFYEKSTSEIALLTGLSAGNVRVNLTRGIQKIKTQFEEKNINWEL